MQSDKAPVEFHSKPEVSDATGAVFLYEDVFALQVSVSDGWFSLRAVDLCMQVTQATGCRVGQSEQGLCVQSGELQIVIQRAVLMVVCDQVQLRRCSSAINVSSNEAFGQNEENRVT